MKPKTLDHVALWTSERDRIAERVTTDLALHVIERTDAFTLVGADARRGKLTLFEAEGPRERGPLLRVALRVRELDGAPAALDLPEGLALALVEASDGVEYDLDHVALLSRTPEETAARYLELGFAPADAAEGGEPRVEVGGAYVEFHEGDPGEPERPLLNHLAVLVDSADEHLAAAEARGISVAKVVDAANTKAVFLHGPEGVDIEYVEHKPTFSLV